MVRPRGPETRYVETADGVSIAYQVFGEGPDLVYNDGWLGNVDANWDVPMIADFLEELGRHARVIMFDRRGFGVSDRPTSVETMSLEKGLDDMRAVMGATGCDRAVVSGFEDGAALSILFAASFPDRTLGLVLATPLVTYWRGPDFPWGWTPEEAATWEGRQRDSWGTIEFWRWAAVENRVDLTDDELASWARWSRLSASPAAMVTIENVMRQIDVRALLPSIPTPTLVFSKAGDRDDPIWGGIRSLAEQIPGARFVEVPGPEHPFLARDQAFFDALDRFLAGIDEERAVFDRVLSTVLFTDIVGSTAKAVSLGDRAWRDVVERHHSTVRSMLQRYRGTEVDTAGDGFFATFDGPARAVRCAQHLAEAMRPLDLEIRAGVHTGEVEMIDGKAGGLAVVIGARIGALAGVSEVLVSQTVKDLVAGSGLTFEERGTHQLKGVPDEWRVFAAIGGTALVGLGLPSAAS